MPEIQLNSIDDRPSDDIRHLCTLYLLGELDDVRRASLEQRLGESSELADELLRQSDCFLAIADCDFDRLDRYPVNTSQSGHRVLALAAALAACLLLVVAAWRSRDNPTAEELLIARAWADSTGAESGSVVTAIDSENSATESTADDPMIATDTSGSFDWMFAAVETEMNDDLGTELTDES